MGDRLRLAAVRDWPAWTAIGAAAWLGAAFIVVALFYTPQHRAVVRSQAEGVRASVLVRAWPGTPCTVELSGPGVEAPVRQDMTIDATGESGMVIQAQRGAGALVLVSTVCRGPIRATSRHDIW